MSDQPENASNSLSELEQDKKEAPVQEKQVANAMNTETTENDKAAVENPYFDPRSNSSSLESLKKRNKSLMSIPAFLNRPEGFYSPNYIPHLKKEFLVHNPVKRSNDDDTPSFKTKRTHKDVGLKKKDNSGLCNRVNHGEKCDNPNCRFQHDLKLYLKNKPLDLGERCPVYDIHGYCPQAFCCRWANAHIYYDQEADTYTIKEESNKIPYIETNSGKELTYQLKRKLYKFEFKPAETQANEQEETPLPDTVDESTEPLKDQDTSEPAHPVGPLIPKERKPIDYHNKVYIAPLTTVGNLPFRRICVDFGADITTSEMCMANNLVKGQVSEWALLRRHPSEKCFGVQLAGGFINDLSYAAELIRRETDVDFVDLNCGCPVDAITRVGAGSALLRKETRLKQICVNMLSNLRDIPLLVKCRVGEKSKTIHNLIPKLQELRGLHGERISAVCIHGRTFKQRYTKLADWDYIRECGQCQRTDLPPMSILGNGDIFDAQMYYDNLKDSALSGCMIGRGALIKPWICTEIKEHRVWDISAQERLDIVKKFCTYGLEHWGSDQQGVDHTRRFLLEWLSFLCRYIPVGILERPQRMNQHPPAYVGRSDLETLLSSPDVKDWIKISEMFLGPVPEGFRFIPKHRSNAYES